jgi:hypothetical protein
VGSKSTARFPFLERGKERNGRAENREGSRSWALSTASDDLGRMTFIDTLDEPRQDRDDAVACNVTARSAGGTDGGGAAAAPQEGGQRCASDPFTFYCLIFG